MSRLRRSVAVAALSLLACFVAGAEAAGPELLIPAPVDYSVSSGVSIGRPVRCRRARGALKRALAGQDDFAVREAYSIKILPKEVRIESFTDEGRFRALKTLEQLRLHSDTLSCCTIVDFPRFRHRGLMIDESRSFKGKDFILRQIDAMALLRLNVLHLHLDDSAGWRMESGSYPRLVDSTAWRWGKSYFEWESGGYRFASKDDPGSYGGYYSEEDLREIVSYAAARYITVIPEIEMPGHSLEVCRAYPETACMLPDGRRATWAWDLCPGSEATYRLLEAVLGEVMEVFTSPYIHIGGDEATMKLWGDCVNCRARMEAEGFTEPGQLQGYLVRRVESFVRGSGRQVIGWDELLEAGVPESAVIQSWRGTGGGAAAAAAGHDVVMSPNSHLYLDYYQDLIRKEPQACGHLQSLRHVYSYNPLEGIDARFAAHVLGVQGNLWCEYIPDPAHAEYMLYPRLFAVAEIAWTPQPVRDYDNFRSRVLDLIPLWRGLGYNCFDTAQETPRARSRCFETYFREGDYNIVRQAGAPTLAYRWSSGARIITDGEYGYKDLDGDGVIDRFEDWRLDAAERAEDLLSRKDIAEILSAASIRVEAVPDREQLTVLFARGLFENPF